MSTLAFTTERRMSAPRQSDEAGTWVWIAIVRAIGELKNQEIAMWYRQRAAELIAMAERPDNDQRLMLLEIAVRYYHSAVELEQERNELPPCDVKTVGSIALVCRLADTSFAETIKNE